MLAAIHIKIWSRGVDIGGMLGDWQAESFRFISGPGK
jgi:hypothetical protein